MPNIRRKMSSNPPSDSSSNESHDATPLEVEVVAQRQPLSRRGHFKSRLGCFNCKRRRVKCNELRPHCSPCHRLELTCTYPTLIAASTGPRPAPSALVLEDLRFYHHFVTGAFPSLPLMADKAWVQAASMSSNYEHLAHAVLGLGASHLSENGNVEYKSAALRHRVVAIKLVNEQLTEIPRALNDIDALIGTLTCLMSQSALMADCMIEYLTMTRGLVLVLRIGISICPEHEQSIFKGLIMYRHVEALSNLVSEQPKDFETIEGFHASVIRLKPLCQSMNNAVYLTALVKCITALRTSGIEAWKRFIALFLTPSEFSNADFLEFVSPTNHIAQLLLIHSFLLDYLLGQNCIAPEMTPRFHGRKNTIIAWVRNLANSLPPEYQEYTEWARQYCQTLTQADSRYLMSP